MAQLMSESKQILVPDLRIADRMWSRMVGLLGSSHLPETQGLWLHRCNSIHTFFMKYTIDCIFVDRDLKVLALKPNVRPGRMVFPVLGAKSVFELPAGSLEKMKLTVGDQLYVGN